MTGPKHLWSGDWQQESAAASDELASRRAKPADPEPTAAPTAPGRRARAPRRAAASAPPGRTRHSLRRRALPLGLAVLLLVAAGAYGLTAVLGSSGPRASTIARGPSGSPAPTVPFVPTTPPPTTPSPTTPPPTSPTPTTPFVPPASPAPATATTPPIPPRPINWLGMEIQTVAPGAAVIDTVAAGSPGALAGLQPGEVIVEINNRPIHGTGDIAPAIRGLRAGDVVEMQISHGSGLRRIDIPLAAPPSVYP